MNHDLYGYDSSQIVIKQAKSRFPYLGGRFSVLDIESHELPSDKYDVIFLHLVLPFLSNKKEVIKKLLLSTELLVLSVSIIDYSNSMSDKEYRVGMSKDEVINLVQDFGVVDILFETKTISTATVITLCA